MNILKILKLLILATFFSTQVSASTGGNPQPSEEEGKKSVDAKKPNASEKVGRETARVIGQVEEGARDIAHGFKKQRHKDRQK